MTFLYKVWRLMFNGLFRLFYRHRVYGQENLPSGAAIIAPNHQSYYDPPLIGISCPCEIYYLARGSLFRWPIFGWLIRRLNAYPLSGTSSDHESIKAVYALLSRNKKVVMFPEGVRTVDGCLSQIKKGIVHIAFRSQAPIVPTYIHGTFEIWHRHWIFPKLWGKTACVFGHPLLPSSYDHMDKSEATDALTTELKEEILKLRDWYLNGAEGPIP